MSDHSDEEEGISSKYKGKFLESLFIHKPYYSLFCFIVLIKYFSDLTHVNWFEIMEFPN